MNKKGFTLIELLAVIVILAIIALIAVPRIAEMIETSRKGSAKDSFYGFIHVVELAYTKELQNNTNLEDEVCTISNSIIICTNGTDIKLSGKGPASGTVNISNGGSATGTNLKFNDYLCSGNLSTENPCKKQVSENSGLTTSELKEKVVTSGDGLYIDPVEASRYIYRGATPDNYIWLDLNGDSSKTDNETFRIMAVEPDNTIKVVAQNTIGKMAWDDNGNRTATGYCSAQWCNAWGSSTTTLDSNGNNVTVMPREAGSSTTYELPTNEASLSTYLNTTYLNSINSNLQSKIATHTYNIGNLKYASGQTLETDALQESAYKWKGKIGLINTIDYVKASTNATCTNFYAYYKTSACYNNSTAHNYLYHSTYELTMSPRSDSRSEGVWIVHSGGNIYPYSASYSYNGVWPVFYLTADINLRGRGTESNPYTITN